MVTKDIRLWKTRDRPPRQRREKSQTLVDSPPAHESAPLLAGVPRTDVSTDVRDSTAHASHATMIRLAGSPERATPMLATAPFCFGSSGCPDRLAGAVTLRPWSARGCGTGLSRPESAEEPGVSAPDSSGPFGRHGLPVERLRPTDTGAYLAELAPTGAGASRVQSARTTADGASASPAGARARWTLSTRSARQCSLSGEH